YIAFGAEAYLLAISDSASFLGFGLSRILGGIVFSVGLIFVVLAGGELFTGNSLVALSACCRRSSWRGVLRNWALVYLFNIAGSLVVAFLIFGARQYTMGDGAVGVAALKVAAAKVSMPFWTAFFRGVLCNWLVCLAVWMAGGATDTAGKVLAIVPPVMVFVASGFEHSVANMFLVPLGLLLKRVPSVVAAAGTVAGIQQLTWVRGFLVGNLLPVTLGNLAGGVLFVAVPYWIVYARSTESR
ncbi:MAG TPA: formate/nitrite transporter family protein, partial [Clostridia bacterium]|nr:formate/nitrite transporter family protein [Clostridia bacterium]